MIEKEGETVLGEFKTGRRNKIVVKLTSYQGEPRFDVRRYFRKAGETEWYPTKAGLSFDRELLEFFVEILRNRPVELEHWLTDLPASSVVKSRLDRERQDEARSANALDDVSYTRRIQKLPRRVFFECVAEGGRYDLLYNRRHELGRELREDGSEEALIRLEVLDAMLVCFQQAIERHTYEGDEVMQRRNALFESVLLTWSQLLSRALARQTSDE